MRSCVRSRLSLGILLLSTILLVQGVARAQTGITAGPSK